MESKKKKVGIISDTHGLFRPQIKEKFADCDVIVHGGDIGNISVIHSLEEIAPVTAVYGNIDQGLLCKKYDKTEVFEFNDFLIYIIHDLQQLKVESKSADIDIIVFCHSHQPYHKYKNGVLYINPGSAGPKRFELPISAAVLEIDKKNEININYLDLSD